MSNSCLNYIGKFDGSECILINEASSSKTAFFSYNSTFDVSKINGKSKISLSSTQDPEVYRIDSYATKMNVQGYYNVIRGNAVINDYILSSSCTKFYWSLLDTGGMRNMLGNDGATIEENFYSGLAELFEENPKACSDTVCKDITLVQARTITGQDEGKFAWLTLKAQQESTCHGVIDVGGQTGQFANKTFAYSGNLGKERAIGKMESGSLSDDDVVAVLKGVANSFISFADGIAARFEALGKDLAAFVENPLSGVSFENTNRVLETGLVQSMSNAFDKALAEAREFNQKLDEELSLSRRKLNKSDSQNPSLEKMFAGQNSKGSANVTKSSSRNYGNITSDSEFDKLKARSFDSSKEIENDFDTLGSKIEDSIASSLKRTGGKFESFADMAKTMLGEISQVLLSNMFQGSGVSGGGFGNILGGLFGGAGGGGASMFGGFFADGGKLAPGKFGVVGENGPELAFAGNSPLNIMPDMPSGGRVTINMNVQTPDINSFRQSSSQVAADIARQIERARRNL